MAPSLAQQHWDSLEYAFAVDSRGPEAIWGNHPLGHAVQRLAYHAAQVAGYDGRALPVLKILTAVCAAGAVAAFALVLITVLGVATLPAVGWALAFGGANGYWHYAGTADFYGFSTLVLVVAWGTLIVAAGGGAPAWRPRPDAAGTVAGATRDGFGTRWLLTAGAAAGVAAVTHQFAGLLLAAGALALWPVWASGGLRRGAAKLAVLGLAAVGVAAVGYGALGAVATGSASFGSIWAWAVGHGSDPSYGRYFNLTGVAYAVGSLSQTLVTLTPAGAWRVGYVALFIVGLMLLVGSVWSVRRLPSVPRAAAHSALTQFLLGSLLIVWWEPGMVGKFWLLPLPMLFALLALSWKGFARVAPGGSAPARAVYATLPLALGMLVFTINARWALSFERRPDPTFEQSLALWLEHSAPDTLILENGRYTTHLLFWGNRPQTSNVYRVIQRAVGMDDPFYYLRQDIEQAARDGREVLLAPGLNSYYTDDRMAVVGTTRAGLAEFLDSLPWSGPVFEYVEWAGEAPKPVYRLDADRLLSAP